MSSIHILPLLLLCLPLARSANSTDRWQDSIPLSTDYLQVAKCAQPCLLQVTTNVSCWSYGCVCSENTNTGSNYKQGLSYVGSCATASCQDSQGAIEVEKAQNAFSDLCRVPFSDILVSTILATATVASNGTQTSILTITTSLPPISSPTPDFNIADAVIIDAPDDAYNALTPCLRFIFNDCKSKKDNPPGHKQNCNGTVPSDTSNWNGLGADLKCSNTECVCSADKDKFSHSLQHAFDNANYYCNTNAPTQEKSSPDFELLGEMLAAYCSSNGFVLGTWYLSLTGYHKKGGLENNDIISLSLGLASLVASVTSVFVALYWTPRKKSNKVKQLQESVQDGGGVLAAGNSEIKVEESKAKAD